MAAHAFVLNGGSSVGKTTTARAMQDAHSSPLLRFGIDDFFATVPEAWGGGRGGPLSARGFHYLDLPDGGGTRIGYGADGWQMMLGYHRAVRAFLDAGSSVVVDELMLGSQVYRDWLVALEGVATTWVRIECPLAVAEQREQDRGQRPGLARGTHSVVHVGIDYDVEVDTTHQTPDAAATSVLASVGIGEHQG